MRGLIHAAIEAAQGKPFAVRSPHWRVVRHQHLASQPACAACGGTTNLEVHHIQPFHLRPDLELQFDNLITLCESKKGGLNCHLALGHMGNYRTGVNPFVQNDASFILTRILRCRRWAETPEGGSNGL